MPDKPDTLIDVDINPDAAPQVRKPEFLLVDLRNRYDSADEAIEAAKQMDGYDDGWIGCIKLQYVEPEELLPGLITDLPPEDES